MLFPRPVSSENFKTIQCASCRCIPVWRRHGAQQLHHLHVCGSGKQLPLVNVCMFVNVQCSFLQLGRQIKYYSLHAITPVVFLVLIMPIVGTSYHDFWVLNVVLILLFSATLIDKIIKHSYIYENLQSVCKSMYSIGFPVFIEKNANKYLSINTTVRFILC